MPRLLLAVAALVAFAFGTALLLGPRTVHALSITVDSLDDTVASDGDCTLREAIENANDTTDGQPNTDCDPGNPAGDDEIDFAVSGTITLDGTSPLSRMTSLSMVETRSRSMLTAPAGYSPSTTRLRSTSRVLPSPTVRLATKMAGSCS